MSPELVGLFALRDPINPAAQPPAALRRVLPRPLESAEGWERFTHTDIVGLTTGQRQHELHQLRAAAGQVEFERIPPWIHERIGRLEASVSRRRAA